MSQQTAQVEVLTAEVRALMVGSRQVTLSVYRQLDVVPDDRCVPFGRVRDSKDSDEFVWVIGKDTETGALVSSRRSPAPGPTACTDPPAKIASFRWAIARQYGEDPSEFSSIDPTSKVLPAAPILTEGGERVTWYLPRTKGLRAIGQEHYDWQQGWRFNPQLDQDKMDQIMRTAREEIVARQAKRAAYQEWAELPLIVLAGLR